jgi:hypothetical protein
MDKATEKWSKLGFLEGIDNDDHKEALANSYEAMAKYLIPLEEDSIPHLNAIASTIFPVLRRSLCEVNYEFEPDPEKLTKFISDTISGDEGLKNLMYLDVCCCWGHQHLDGELEASKIISELVTKELENGRLL